MKKKTEQKSEVNSLEAAKDRKVISSMIHDIRGLQVMLDKDLAALYGVETKVLNQAVKRNIDQKTLVLQRVIHRIIVQGHKL